MIKSKRVIIDTNVWISYLIGYELRSIDELLKSGLVRLIVSKNLLEEVSKISQREKFRRYFSLDDSQKLLRFIRMVAEVIQPEVVKNICRDPKDDFLLALAEASQADFLITGDKVLLVLNLVGNTRIVTPQEFTSLI